MEVSATGFKRFVLEGITLQVQQTARIDVHMMVGEVAESVTVTADLAGLETETATLSKVVDNRSIINLPLNGRNAYDLVLLAPGATAYGRPPQPGNNIPLSNMSINGGPGMTNEFLMDGIPNETIVQSQFVMVPSIDAVQEFKVQTNSLSAEFGSNCCIRVRSPCEVRVLEDCFGRRCGHGYIARLAAQRRCVANQSRDTHQLRAVSFSLVARVSGWQAHPAATIQERNIPR